MYIMYIGKPTEVVVRTLESNSSVNRVLHKMSLWVG